MSEASERPSGREAGGEHEPPPIFGSWRKLYALVALALLLEILFFAWVSRLGP
jgi:hypothetical protein